MNLHASIVMCCLAGLVGVLGNEACYGEVQSAAIPYEHDGTKLTGYLAYDDALQGKRPAVLVVHEWWGLNDYARRRADQLAQLGYVAFALDMYGDGKVTEHPRQASEWANEIRQNVDQWRGRAVSGLNILRNQEWVDSSRVAAVGYCFGGATVLQLAYAGEDLTGVVSFHGSLPAATPEQAAQIKSRILICHGAADPFIPAEQIDSFRKGLEGTQVDLQMIFYGGAKHSFTNPDADQVGLDGLKYDPLADQRSWSHMQLFFNELFAGKEE